MSTRGRGSMRSSRGPLAALAFLMLIMAGARADPLADITQGLCERIAPAPCPRTLVVAVAAYVYGYPLVMVDVTKSVATNVRDATTTLLARRTTWRRCVRFSSSTR